jgi:hypothetical protein
MSEKYQQLGFEKEKQPQVLNPELEEIKRQTTRVRRHTVIFDAEEDYVHFTNYAFDEFDGQGLEFSSVPIPTSIRIRRWLFDHALEQGFSLRTFSQEDGIRIHERLKGRKPFDPANLTNFHVPGEPDL